MRFAVSLLNFRPGRIGGAETYLRQLVRWLPSAAEGDELVVLLPRDVARTLETPGWRRVVVDLGDLPLVAARLAEAFTPWRARGLERLLSGLRPDAILFPQQSLFPKRAPAPAVLTVGDVQHLFFPERFGWFDRAFRRAIYPYSLRAARRVLAVSAYTRQTLVGRAGVPAPKIEVVPYGWAGAEDAPAVRPLDEVPAPYLYYPAASYPHKNHATLFRTYAALRRRGAVHEPLVLTGERTSHWRGLDALLGELGLREHVRHLGYLRYEDVRRVYAGASAVLFPTTFEGFGLPVLEAVELGKKVVTSRLEVFDEIGVPASCQVDFEDPEQLAAGLRAPGPTRLTRRPLTWGETARATMSELRRAARPG